MFCFGTRAADGKSIQPAGQTSRTFWHTQSPETALRHLGASEGGLSESEAKARFSRFGENALPAGKTDGLFVIFLRQFQSPLIYVLFFAAGIVLAMGEAADALVIFAVLFFNAVIGAFQEGRAQNTLLALRRFSATRATVLRDGREVIIGDAAIVPGDILILREGEKISADARILSVAGFKTDEASLTGESLPVIKSAENLANPNLPVSERCNMAYKGTFAVGGTARAVVVATGLETELGRIAAGLRAVDTEIPLKKSMRALSRAIIALVALISALIFLIGTWRSLALGELFATIVALAVSIIPEGLPVVLTLVLATGVWRMSKRNALVKRLQAVEALGQTRVIAVDKTGTLTRNEIAIEQVFVDDKHYSVSGNGYEPKGGVFLGGKPVGPPLHDDLMLAGRIAAFCASARVSFDSEEKLWRVAGDPTEAALLVFGEKVGFNQAVLRTESPPIFEIPFSASLRYHLMVHRVAGKRFLTAIGALETILPHCKRAWRGGKATPLSAELREHIEDEFVRLAKRGYRVLAFAMQRNAPDDISPQTLDGLTLVGFFGMRDPLRPEVKDAMRAVREANIRVVMLTGDHKLTAEAIAREVGILGKGESVLTGAELDGMDERELAARVSDVSVFARVTPEHKLKIIGAFRKRKEIIAMTGDGVNDAPSLVAADLGVAMGNIGTEVTKEAADIVLLDDNFGSIVAAAEEGRSIYRTVKKVVLYLFSTSLGEVLTIAGALVAGLPLPLLPTQIIWLNFVTDGFLTAALAMEPKEEKLLSQPFSRPNRFFLDRLMVFRMILMALAMSVGTLLLFSFALEASPAKALTISLTVLAVFQWWNAWNCRHERYSIFGKGVRRNLWLISATGIVITLQLLAVYHPALQHILHTVPLSLADWGIIIAVATSILIAEESRKWLARRISAGAA